MAIIDQQSVHVLCTIMDKNNVLVDTQFRVMVQSATRQPDLVGDNRSHPKAPKID